MGLFDINDKMNQSLFKGITKDVALAMCNAKIVPQPFLKFLRDDGGFLEGLVSQHTSDIQMKMLLNQDLDTYLFVCGMHAFGAGIYVAVQQNKLNKAITEFTGPERMQIARAFEQTDSYELGLGMIGIGLDSRNKQVTDYIIMTGKDAVLASSGRNASRKENIWAYMQVMFNAGITMALR